MSWFGRFRYTAFTAVVISCQSGWADTPRHDDLDARVSVEQNANSLRALLQSVSKQTGSHLECSDDVADIRVTAVLVAVPIERFKASLAEVLHLSWKEVARDNTQAVPRHVLYRSARDRAEELRLLTKGESAFRDGIKTALGLLSLRPDEVDKLAETDPALAHSLSEPRSRSGLSILSRLAPEQLQRVFDGQELHLGVSGLPRETQSLLVQHRNLVLSLDGHPDENPSASEELVIRRSQEGAGSAIIVEQRRPGMSCSTSHYSPWSKKSASQDEATPHHAGEEHQSARKTLNLLQTLRGSTADELLLEAAKALRLNVIAESYAPLEQRQRAIRPGKTTVEAILDQVVVHGYEIWWKREGLYLVQHKYWYLDRLAEVPDEVIQRLKSVRRTGKPLSLEDWSELGKLRPEQWNKLSSLGLGEFDTALGLHPLLSFYSRLARLHRTSLFSNAGLDVAKLPRDLQDRLASWVSARQSAGDWKMLLSNDTTIGRLRLRASSDEHSTNFQLFVVMRDGESRMLLEQLVPGPPVSFSGSVK